MNNRSLIAVSRFVPSGILRSRFLMLVAVPLISSAGFVGNVGNAHAAELGLIDKKIELLVDGTVHQALFAVDFQGDHGIAVGAEGEIQQTKDGGKSWKQGRLPTESALLSIHMDSKRSLVVGQAGLGFKGAAGSDEFQEVDTGTDSRLFAVHANQEGLAAAVGEFGTMILSEDGGTSWKTLAPDWEAVGTLGGAEPHLYGVHISDAGEILAVGEFGLVIRSSDKGATWTTAHMADASLFDIEILADGQGYAVGQDGYAIKSEDAGISWSVMETGSKAILIGIQADASGKVALTAMRELLVSDNAGTSWKAVDDPQVTTVWYVGIASSGSQLVAVGQNGRIIKIGS